MKELIKKWNSISLILRILVGLILGIATALLFPHAAVIGILGDVFVGALKAVAPILVFVLVLSALANASGGVGKRFRTVIILYMLSTLLAAVAAVVASFVFPVTMNLTDVSAAADATPPSGIGEVLSQLISNMVINPVQSLASANYIGILFWAVVFGIAMKTLASDTTKQVAADLADVVSTAVRWIINTAPFGIMGLSYNSIASGGLEVLLSYGRLLAVLVGTMLFEALIINPIIASLFLKRNAYPLVLRCLRESGVTAFFTRSSAANIPINMALCERLGLDEDFYSVSIPLGSTINMDGAAITITIMTLSVAYTLGIAVDVPTAIVLSVLATLGACGASGVAGGSLLLIPMACSLFGISNDIAMQAVTVGFIIGIVQDSLETALNSSGDVLFTATAEFHDRLKRGEEIHF
jgi:serine/threonine transporter